MVLSLGVLVSTGISGSIPEEPGFSILANEIVVVLYERLALIFGSLFIVIMMLVLLGLHLNPKTRFPITRLILLLSASVASLSTPVGFFLVFRAAAVGGP